MDSLGAVRFEKGRRAAARDFLLLAAEPFQDKKILSELSGQDGAYHDTKPEEAISATRKFLASKLQGVLPAAIKVRSASLINARFARFKQELPGMASDLKFSALEIESFDCLPEWLNLAIKWQGTPQPGL